MPTRLKLCENCGGKLEVPYKWRKLIVCGSCFSKLTDASAGPIASGRSNNYLSSMIWILLAISAVSIGIVLRFANGSRPVHSSDAESAPVNQRPIFIAHRSDDPADLLDFPTIPSTPPPATTPSAGTSTEDSTLTGTVIGVLKLSGRAADPEPQVNVRVELIQPTVSREVFITSLATQAIAWRQLGSVADSLAAVEQQNNDADDSGTPANNSAAYDLANEAATGIIQLRTAARLAPAELDSLTALRTLRDTAAFNIPDFSAAIAAATVMEVRTNAAGEFVLEARPGDYYLHASVGSGINLVEWCVPVQIQQAGETIRADLSSANATVIAANR